MHSAFRDAGHGDHIFGPPIHGIGIEFEEAPLPPGHAFFHGEKEPDPLRASVVLAVGNCGLYSSAWGVRWRTRWRRGRMAPRYSPGTAAPCLASPCHQGYCPAGRPKWPR